MKDFRFFAIAIFCMASKLIFAQDMFGTSTNNVSWVKSCAAERLSENEIMVDDSSDIHIEPRFKMSDDGNHILFKMAVPYNCLSWMETARTYGEERLVPDSDRCYAALFVYSEKSKRWVGGPIAEIQSPLVEQACVSGLYDGTINGWPRLKTRLNNGVRLRLCLCKFIRGKWRRSNWSYNFSIE